MNSRFNEPIDDQKLWDVIRGIGVTSQWIPCLHSEISTQALRELGRHFLLVTSIGALKTKYPTESLSSILRLESQLYQCNEYSKWAQTSDTLTEHILLSEGDSISTAHLDAYFGALALLSQSAFARALLSRWMTTFLPSEMIFQPVLPQLPDSGHHQPYSGLSTSSTPTPLAFPLDPNASPVDIDDSQRRHPTEVTFHDIQIRPLFYLKQFATHRGLQIREFATSTGPGHNLTWTGYIYLEDDTEPSGHGVGAVSPDGIPWPLSPNS
ncbi:hypothetical protein CALCODRAFT_509365 [Calocera cornea HHB12733]|uniref:Uncharacterized protein n=1 Tax=Calocera cornea HHB12733 TaxID=1353952 RepID=A0A165FDM4_9BASI|nr:hypothetical protein CALCODRAFT_509365 [Calocera cornea HHB12733]